MDKNALSVRELKNLFAQSDEITQKKLIEQYNHDSRASVQALLKQVQGRIAKNEQESKRLKELWLIEDELYQEGCQYICGCDEVGRGPLAGPVVAAAVIMPRDCLIYGVNDSKKITHARRLELAEEIKDKALAYAISEISPRIIDAVNILQASRLAMAEAVKNLSLPADFIVVDGWANPLFELPQKAIVKGDGKCFSIACASILAKVYRDELMEKLEEKYPGYGFAQHKGYPTKEHYEALKRLGPSDIHRISFDLKLQ